MWKAKIVNWITNVFGVIGGVPEIIEGSMMISTDPGQGIALIAKGVGILAIGYFTGKSTLALEPGK